MQKILLALSFILLLDVTYAASLSSKPATAALGTTYPKLHLRFKERKGTMGFVYSVLLGPVGYFGVKIFSRHDEMMCYQAGRGFKVWGMVVTSMLLLGVAVALKGNSDSVSPLLNALWSTPL
jgi:hypothetical protein